MNFKLISLIFSGVTLAGGATAFAVIKNKNSSPQIEINEVDSPDNNKGERNDSSHSEGIRTDSVGNAERSVETTT